MKPMAISLLYLLLASSSLPPIARAQGRAPHGLVYESPMAFSPSAFEFFHPNSPKTGAKDPCSGSSCGPMPLAAQIRSTPAEQSKFSTSQSSEQRVLGAGGIVGIVFGFVLVVLLAMGVYYVTITRRSNVNRANSVGPDA